MADAENEVAALMLENKRLRLENEKLLAVKHDYDQLKEKQSRVSSLLLRTQTVLEGWSAHYAGLKEKINSLETSLATFATKLDNIEEVVRETLRAEMQEEFEQIFKEKLRGKIELVEGFMQRMADRAKLDQIKQDRCQAGITLLMQRLDNISATNTTTMEAVSVQLPLIAAIPQPARQIVPRQIPGKLNGRKRKLIN